MILAQVVGSIWSSEHDPGMDGQALKLLLPEDARTRQASGNTLLAVDLVGARTGDTVIIVYEGSSARMCIGSEQTPAEAVIVGIVDQLEMRG